MNVAVIAGLWALALSSLAPAQDRLPPPVPIEEWSKAKIISLGREIYVQDTAAWVATDALLEALTDEEEATIRGWVVLGDGPTRTVRFLKADGDSLAPGWDIAVTDGVASQPIAPDETTLAGETLARFRARETAAAQIGALRCGRYNSVVAKNPDGEGWLVWLLTASPAQGVMPVGGHYRFHVSADGQTVLRRDQLSNSCLNMPADPPPGPQGQPGVLLVSQIVSQGPVETHVFLSLQYRKQIYVVAGNKLFAVREDQIREVDTSR